VGDLSVQQTTGTMRRASNHEVKLRAENGLSRPMMGYRGFGIAGNI
jgi:hypothetical protein